MHVMKEKEKNCWGAAANNEHVRNYDLNKQNELLRAKFVFSCEGFGWLINSN